jgi:hypothetical protein
MTSFFLSFFFFLVESKHGYGLYYILVVIVYPLSYSSLLLFFVDH